MKPYHSGNSCSISLFNNTSKVAYKTLRQRYVFWVQTNSTTFSRKSMQISQICLMRGERA